MKQDIWNMKTTTPTCRCGKPVRRIVDYDTPPERVVVPQSTSGEVGSFVYLRNSDPAPDGRCDRCHAAGRQFLPREYTPDISTIKRKALQDWEEEYYRRMVG